MRGLSPFTPMWSGIVLVESSKHKAYGLVKQSSLSAVLSFAFQK